ncbi:Protein bark beetle [Eumeta japonica]|uniref:Protein bark beetle n=1 Tax=Eumeta variegata TaxID=151549 RepID=A0A4C1T4I3_EUMVA|nr:Protein bark beetle [Eumeta japonica]
MNFSSLAELRSHNNSQISNATANAPPDIRRPDSYMTAVGTNRLSRPVSSLVNMPKYDTPTSLMANKRPKTVYESDDTAPTTQIPSSLRTDERKTAYKQRSRSEALLETDLDLDNTPTMDANGRSYSQPLETSM